MHPELCQHAPRVCLPEAPALSGGVRSRAVLRIQKEPFAEHGGGFHPVHPTQPRADFDPAAVLTDLLDLLLNALGELARDAVVPVDIALETVAAARIIVHLDRKVGGKGIALPDFLRQTVVFVAGAADADCHAVPFQLGFHGERHFKIDIAFPHTISDRAGVASAVAYADKYLAHCLIPPF